MDARLMQIIDMFRPCNIACDVGTDHGQVIVELVKSGLAKYGIATDIAEKPLASACKNIQSNGLSDKIETILSDGLKCVTTRPDAVVIAGMGGELISKILNESPFSDSHEILYYLLPMTKPERLRKYLYSNGYNIISEKCTVAHSRPYSVILAQKRDDISTNTVVDENLIYLGKIDPHTDTKCIPYLLKLEKQLDAKLKFDHQNQKLITIKNTLNTYLKIAKTQKTKN